ncbi:MAG: GTPase, partial [Moorea sp. SIO4E2]|nr:GTPase [Moorena sp. SIO4E2]
QQQYVWKSGVILTKDNTKAEVIEYYGKREIKIRVTGRDKRGLLSIVAYELDKINASYQRLKYSQFIPCNCPTCKDSQSPYYYPFETLLKYIEYKEYNIKCETTVEDVNVWSLLGDIIDWKLVTNDPQDINKLIDGKRDIKSVFILQNIYYFSKTMANINDQSRNTNISGSGNISGNAKVTNTGAGAFSLGDISGTVANTINQLPSFDAEPDKKQLKELLSQLQSVVIEEELDEDDKEEALEQIKAIASALTNSEDGAVKKVVKKAMTMLKGIATNLPRGAAMITIIEKLPALISKIF